MDFVKASRAIVICMGGWCGEACRYRLSPYYLRHRLHEVRAGSVELTKLTITSISNYHLL